MARSKAIPLRSQKPTPQPETTTMGDPAMNLPSTTFPLMGQEVGLLIECNQKLQELGIEKTIKLPQICVIGDQSAGKSSLIEAISTVKVPRAAGCCTQCPLAINLSAGPSPDAPFTCKIIIEARYRFNHERRGRQPSKAVPMGPWIIQHEIEMIEFASTNDKEEVCELIQMAQTAILNPSTLSTTTRANPSLPKPEVNAVKFSPNVIRLDITEGNWPSLSFIDLPGVITNVSRHEDGYLVKLVENLVLEYAGCESSINLLTLPMTNDPENSKSKKLIHDLAAEDRTMVVLTKPDRADAEARPPFLATFAQQDDDRAFEHGYHMVMLAQCTADQEELVKREEVFFSQEPWCNMDIQARQRLGVSALGGFLRQLLFKKTLEALPQNLAIIDRTLEQIEQDLSHYPPPPNAARLPVLLARLVDNFSRAIQAMFDGGGSVHTFLKGANKLAEEFRKDIFDMTPTLFIGTKKENRRYAKLKARRGTAANAPLEIPSDDDGSHGRTPTHDTPTRPRQNNLTHRFTLEEIKGVLGKFAHYGLPDQPHPKATEEMTMTCLENWDQPLEAFLAQLTKLLTASVLGEVDTVFHDYTHLPLRGVIVKFVKNFLQRAILDEQSKVEELCVIEQTCLHTLDNETWKMKVSKHRDVRQKKRTEFCLKVAQLAADLQAADNKTKKATINAADLGADPYQNEIDKSAEVKAYYEIAAARFTDAVYQRIRAKLFRECGHILPAQLRAFLEPDDGVMTEQLIEWMTEDGERARIRRQLMTKRDHLIKGKQYIERVLGCEPGAEPAVETNVVRGLGRRQRSRSDAVEFDNDPDTPTRKRNRMLQPTVESDEMEGVMESRPVLG